MPICISATLQVEQSPPASVADCPYVVFTGAESVQAFSSPWNLTVSEATQIGSAICAVWGLAWAFRALADFLKSSDKESEE